MTRKGAEEATLSNLENEQTMLRRNQYIGGADAATVIGANRYNSVYHLWRAKTENIDRDLSGNVHIQRGETIEPIINQYVLENLDPTVNSEDNWKRHDAGLAERRFEQRAPDAQIMLLDDEPSPVNGTPFIGGHPDGVGDEILWEYKAPTSYKLEMIQRSGLPENWLYQVHHYMMISGLMQGCVAVWDFNRWEPWLFWIKPDFELYDIMRKRYRWFWQHVETNTPPESELPHLDHQSSVIYDDDLEDMFRQYRESTEMRYRGEEQQKKLRGQILTIAGDRRTLVTPNFVCEIKEVRGNGGTLYKRLTVSEVTEGEE